MLNQALMIFISNQLEDALGVEITNLGAWLDLSSKNLVLEFNRLLWDAIPVESVRHVIVGHVIADRLPINELL